MIRTDAELKKIPLDDLAQSLKKWYIANRRDLLWRQTQDAYKIWISEVMLQQTTVQAVIPYFERFIGRFPNVVTLAEAPLTEVLKFWAGLGYYSRARNLHLAAKTLAATGFPQTATELIQLPGFGPYTSRAVASIAFEEPVGVLDGNVIRVLSRLLGRKKPWWESLERNFLQETSDQLSRQAQPSIVNQALMELGATLCTPRNPLCLLCPWKTWCAATKAKDPQEFPLKKPRRESEVWIWQIELLTRKDKIGLIKNTYLPFLKGTLVFPGRAQKQLKSPSSYLVKHRITHHDIFVQRLRPSQTRPSSKDLVWIPAEELNQHNPSILLTKSIHALKK